jgi:serine/threonine protein kinase
VQEDFDYSLKDLLLRNKALLDERDATAEIYVLAYHLAHLLHRLKRIGVCHNNIAPENVFVREDPRTKLKQILLGNFEHAILREDHFARMRIEFTHTQENLKYKAPEVYSTI